MGKELRNLIFDFGNVLIGVDEAKTYKAFEELGCKPELQDNTGLFHSLDKGEITQDEFLVKLKDYVPKHIMRRDLLAAWNALLLSIPDTSYDLLKTVRTKFSLALLSNTSVPHISEIKRAAGPYDWKRFASFFEAMHYSFDLGCRKPEAEIFAKVEVFHGWEAESCILVDDRDENLKAAEDRGWTAIHFAMDQGDSHAELVKTLLALS